MSTANIAKNVNEVIAPHAKATAKDASAVPSAKDIELFQNLFLDGNEKERGFILKKMKGIVGWIDRMATLKQTQQRVAEAEKRLAKGADTLFLQGDVPTKADVELFNSLLGEENTALHRWVKHMASFSEAERAAFAAPASTADAVVYSAKK